jgi:alkanesulfonate monooxygenase SsuD/methylene tetrahydromethanopterin reductase-like flavin-dependent oxidoreductase (luciferase family)
MKFDVFHSIGRIDSVYPRLTDRQVFQQFFEQVIAAETLGYETIWVAESHFSSEVQKKNADPVIPNYQGEVGLNADSMQLAGMICERTERIGFGTAIMNIVGGNGGPLAAADRVRSLAWHNSLRKVPRKLWIGVANGRFPYINRPFGITPRSQLEVALWSQYQALIFTEALEVFLRLLRGETLSSSDITKHKIDRASFRDQAQFIAACEKLRSLGVSFDESGADYINRWTFERLKLVPDMSAMEIDANLRCVLGSSDPYARSVGLKFADLDIFNLSFTPPEALNKLHLEMFDRYKEAGRQWHRSRLPRTVLVFIDRDRRAAQEAASRCFDTYIEAMRGTVQMPPKEFLMDRALIGTPTDIKQALSPDDPHGFHAEDRLMLWFEFNEPDNKKILRQMQLFADEVAPHFRSS